jgi:hypothetical protein
MYSNPIQSKKIENPARDACVGYPRPKDKNAIVTQEYE